MAPRISTVWKGPVSFYDQGDADGEFVDTLLDLYGFLKKQTDFSPLNEALCHRLGAFVADAMWPRSPDAIQDIMRRADVRQVMPDLRLLLARAETAMEHFCSDAMANPDLYAPKHRVYTRFSSFLYMDNYKALVENECSLLGWPKHQPSLNPETQSVAFIGSGPLPISAILFHLRTGLPVTCVDVDAEACAKARRLVQALARQDERYAGLPKALSFVQADGAAYDYVTHPIVFVASLIPQKDQILFRIITTTNTGAHVVVRSSEGLGALLYEPYVCAAGLENYNLYPKWRVGGCARTVNTSILFKFPSGKLRARHKIGPLVIPDEIEKWTAARRRMWRTQPAP